MSDLARWYVVHTYSGYENKVATNLEKIVENRKLHDWIHEIRVPTETVVEIKDNKKREVERKFPRLRAGQDGDDGRFLVCRAQHPGLHRLCRA